MMTIGIQNTVEAWTGARPLTCPWRVFFEPFVQRVIRAFRAFDKGQTSLAEPNPSARVAAGVLHYAAALESCEMKRMELDAEARKRG